MEEYYNPREYFENLERTRQQSTESLQRMHDLGMNAGSTLPATDDSMWSYNLETMSERYIGPMDTIRAARFEDGIYYIARMQHGRKMMQYDFRLSKEEGTSRMMSYEVDDINGKLMRSRWRHNLSRFSLADGLAPMFISRALEMVEDEAGANPPWPNALTKNDLKPFRRIIRVRKAIQIAMNPELGEPYL